MKKNSAFTLIELLITLTLFIFILSITIPSFRHFVADDHSYSYIRLLASALSFARSEAIHRNEKIIFCSSKSHKTCEGQWRDGQIIMTENKKILRVYDSLPQGDDLTWLSSLGENDALEFLPTGFTNGQNGSFYYCPIDKQYARKIVVEKSGRIRIVDRDVKCSASMARS